MPFTPEGKLTFINVFKIVKQQEFAVQKSVDVRAVQQQFIDDVIKMGELSAGKAEWLTKEHKHQQEEVQHLYDDEIAQQRMNLEEKYTRRRALALDSVRASNLLFFRHLCTVCFKKCAQT